MFNWNRFKPAADWLAEHLGQRRRWRSKLRPRLRSVRQSMRGDAGLKAIPASDREMLFIRVPAIRAFACASVGTRQIPRSPTKWSRRSAPMRVVAEGTRVGDPCASAAGCAVTPQLENAQRRDHRGAAGHLERRHAVAKANGAQRGRHQRLQVHVERGAERADALGEAYSERIATVEVKPMPTKATSRACEADAMPGHRRQADEHRHRGPQRIPGDEPRVGAGERRPGDQQHGARQARRRARQQGRTGTVRRTAPMIRRGPRKRRFRSRRPARSAGRCRSAAPNSPVSSGW